MPSDPDATGWPDPQRPGVPRDPERDGWHWLAWPDALDHPCPRLWSSMTGGWVVWSTGAIAMPTEAIIWMQSYLGPCLTPAEVAAREAAAEMRGREDSRRICESRERGWSGVCGFREQEAQDILEAIAAIPPPAGQPALDEAIARARAEAFEEAAKVAEKIGHEEGRAECCGNGCQGSEHSAPECCGDPNYVVGCHRIAAAIRALAQPAAQGGGDA